MHNIRLNMCQIRDLKERTEKETVGEIVKGRSRFKIYT